MPTGTNSNTAIEIYKTPDVTVEVLTDYQNEEVWLTQKQIATLLHLTVPVVSKHVAYYRNDNPDEASTVSLRDIVTEDGKTRTVEHYSMDVILQIGYRARSNDHVRAFRKWVANIVTQHVKPQQQDPILALMEGVKQTRLAQIELEQHVHEHDNRLNALEAGRGYVTLKGYYNLRRKIAPDKPTLSGLGKRAVQLSTEMGYEISSVPDETYGRVRAYHQDVLERLLGF